MLSKYTLIIAFLSINTLVYAQKQLLKNFDFDKGGYSLLGISREGGPNKLAHSLGEFYTDDIQLLNAIKKEWIFKKPSPMYSCGYNYQIVICKNGLTLKQFFINLGCHTLATDDGYFYFKEEQLGMFKDKFKKPDRKRETFSTFNEARVFREKALKKSRLIYVETPEWMDYEGTFSFTYTYPKSIKNHLDNDKKILETLKNELQKTYPEERFELHDGGGSKEEMDVAVKCNKSLSDKFQLYKRNIYSGTWRPYSLSLETYWLANTQWYNLLWINTPQYF
jgi:hypothetical protein